MLREKIFFAKCISATNVALVQLNPPIESNYSMSFYPKIECDEVGLIKKLLIGWKSSAHLSSLVAKFRLYCLAGLWFKFTNVMLVFLPQENKEIA